MRTTIELSFQNRARLLELAARRGQKGISSLIAEAVDIYLMAQVSHKQELEKILALKGSLSSKDAENMRREVLDIRRHWR